MAINRSSSGTGTLSITSDPIEYTRSTTYTNVTLRRSQQGSLMCVRRRSFTHDVAVHQQQLTVIWIMLFYGHLIYAHIDGINNRRAGLVGWIREFHTSPLSWTARTGNGTIINYGMMTISCYGSLMCGVVFGNQHQRTIIILDLHGQKASRTPLAIGICRLDYVTDVEPLGNGHTP